MARAQSGPSSCKPHTLAPGRPHLPQPLGPPRLSHPGLLLLCIRFSSQAGCEHTHQDPGLTGEGWTQRPADGMSGFSQMWCVCPRAAGTDDHRLGGSSEHRCVTFGVRSLKSVSWGQKQGVGGCVPPGLREGSVSASSAFGGACIPWLTALPHRQACGVGQPFPGCSGSLLAGRALCSGRGGVGWGLHPEGWNSCHTCRASGSRCCGTDVLKPVTWLR